MLPPGAYTGFLTAWLYEATLGAGVDRFDVMLLLFVTGPFLAWLVWSRRQFKILSGATSPLAASGLRPPEQQIDSASSTETPGSPDRNPNR